MTAPSAIVCFDRPLPIGMRIGLLTVTGWKFHKQYPDLLVHILRCDCGAIEEVPSNALKMRLSFDYTLSCRTIHNPYMRKGLASHGDSGTRLYRCWINMRKRCSDSKCRAYHRYGGRGIGVCAEWEYDYHAFKVWSVQHGYREGLEIDRIDNDGNYEPSNCRYVTKQENLKNRGHKTKE